VRFYQLRPYQKGIAEIQVSHKLMPFLVELSIHCIFFARCNVLKSKWSQRMYELCQNGKVLTALESVDELRLSFMLEEKYNRYALLNERVLQVAKQN
jgi:plasmid replication initiation protein